MVHLLINDGGLVHRGLVVRALAFTFLSNQSVTDSRALWWSSVFEAELAEHIPVVKTAVAGTRLVGRLCVGRYIDVWPSQCVFCSFLDISPQLLFCANLTEVVRDRKQKWPAHAPYNNRSR